MSEDQGIEVINATIYQWQKEALRKRQETLGLISLSEALRSVLNELLTRPVATPDPEQVA
jgi:hypothetical protein